MVSILYYALRESEAELMLELAEQSELGGRLRGITASSNSENLLRALSNISGNAILFVHARTPWEIENGKRKSVDDLVEVAQGYGAKVIVFGDEQMKKEQRGNYPGVVYTTRTSLEYGSSEGFARILKKVLAD